MRLSRVLPFVLTALGVALIPRLAWWDRDAVELELAVAGPPPDSCASHPPEGLTWMLNHIKARRVGAPGWALFPGALNAAELRDLSAVYIEGGLACAAASSGTPGRGDALKVHLNRWLRAADGRALTELTSRGGAAIGEAGVLSSVVDSEARWRVEDCFRVRWTGWIGLSVDDIGDPSRTPGWVLDVIRREGDVTTVSGPAVIFLRSDQALVLRGDLELEGEVHEIEWMRSTESIPGEGVSGRVPYRGWFEVVQPRGGSDVLAEHRIHVTQWGAEKLADAGLSETFPCFVTYRGAYTSYYIAASLSQSGPADIWTKMAGYPKFASAVASRFGNPRKRAFWRFYYPVMREVIMDAGRSWERAAG